MVYVHAHLQRLVRGFRAIDRENREQLLRRQRMFPAHALNRRNQQFRVRRDGDADEARDVRGLLPHCHRLHAPRFGINHRAFQ